MSHIPRLVISGLSGGSGKTLLSLALTRVWQRAGLAVQPFKKGPDYIDAAWLGLAAQRPAANLDPYFSGPKELQSLFLNRALCTGQDKTSAQGCLALIEGNRGLFDGRDLEGTCSTAHVAQCLQAPVVLALNCSKMTRTAAAVVGGIQAFEPGLKLAGVVLNNLGSARHATLVRQAIEHYTQVPVLGILPRQRQNPMPERHMGLSLNPYGQEEANHILLEKFADLALENLNIDALFQAAKKAPELKNPLPQPHLPPHKSHGPTIGVVRDNALWFYYQENLEALEQAGANLCFLSLFDPKPWPHLDGLYLGGGYPELHKESISASPHLAEISALAHAGHPIYAECGGFMILAQSLDSMPMAALFPCNTSFHPRPQALGYVKATTILANCFHPLGSIWKGHEFHYSRASLPAAQLYALNLDRGTGMNHLPKKPQDGLVYKNTFAAYTHLYAPAAPHWAENFVEACVRG